MAYTYLQMSMNVKSFRKPGDAVFVLTRTGVINATASTAWKREIFVVSEL